jgi:phosphate-selective porin OprO and OprP
MNVSKIVICSLFFFCLTTNFAWAANKSPDAYTIVSAKKARQSTNNNSIKTNRMTPTNSNDQGALATPDSYMLVSSPGARQIASDKDNIQTNEMMPPTRKADSREGTDVDHFKFHYSDWGLRLSSPNDDFVTNLYGYVQFDAMQFFGNRPLRSGTRLHQAKLELTGIVKHNWGYGIYYDFATPSLYEAYMSYLGWHNQKLTVGQYGPDFSMAGSNSSNRINFLETPLPVSAFSPFYYEGVFYKAYNDHFVFSGALFGEGLQNQGTAEGRTAANADVRVTYSPIHTVGRVIHFAAADWIGRPNGSQEIEFSTVPEVKNHNAEKLLDTGTISNVHAVNRLNLEAAAVYNSWTFQAEFIQTHLNRDQYNLNFYGGYATVSYFLTGESRIYYLPDGDFNDISPIRHSYGAWQVLGQYSYLSLTDHDINGGREGNYTLGLNWYPNRYFEIKFMLIHIVYDHSTTLDHGTTNVAAIRTQIKF